MLDATHKVVNLDFHRHFSWLGTAEPYTHIFLSRPEIGQSEVGEWVKNTQPPDCNEIALAQTGWTRLRSSASGGSGSMSWMGETVDGIGPISLQSGEHQLLLSTWTMRGLSVKKTEFSQ